MAGGKRRRQVKAENGRALIVVDGPEEGAPITRRLREKGYAIETVHGLKEGTEAARSRAFDMVVFCGKEGDAAEAEVVKAARAMNGAVEVIHAEPEEPPRARVALESVLRGLSLREELRQVKRRLDNLLGGVFDGVAVVDVANGTVAWANPAAAKLLGYDEKEMEGMSVWELIPEDGQGEAAGIFERSLKAANVEGGRLVLRRKDDDLLHCQFNAALMGASSEALVQIVFQDIGERRRLLQQLTELGEALSLGQVISGIVHEINNPLAAILGYAQLCLTTTSRKKLDEYLQTIYQQAGRCQAISQKLSSFGRRREPHRRVTDLNKIIREVVSLFDDELRASNIEVKLSFSSSALPVRVDADEMQQVFVNIINNAKEAMAGTAKGVISIVSQRSGSEAQVTVSDNGHGIGEEVRNKIFQPFFTTKPHGTGLGLSISRAILHGCEGEIEVVGKADRGATFRIRLPLVGDVTAHDSATEAEPREGPPGGKKILVIDGEKPIANLVREILKEAGEKVDVALTPTQARRRINGKDYDMILIDIKLPGGDGRKIFRRLKETKPNVAEKVVFCTGDRLDEETRSFLSGLDNCAVEKGFSVSRIYAVAKRVL